MKATDYRRALAGEIILMSPAGEALLRERLRLLDVEMVDLKVKLGYDAQDYPDLRENTTFGDMTMKVQLDLPRQIGDLRAKLVAAEVVSKEPGVKISFGSKFRAAIADNEPIDYVMLGPVEASYMKPKHGAQIISYMSPIGRAVWGAKLGDERSLELSTGSKRILILDQ